jgi:hypothetical protein
MDVRFAGIYGVAVGLLMLAQWTFFLATGSVPELQSAPLAIAFHIAAEGLCALALLLTGLALLRKQAWGERFYPVAAGMVLYSEVNSPGYFAQSGQWALVAMFAVLALLALASLAGPFRATSPRDPATRMARPEAQHTTSRP